MIESKSVKFNLSRMTAGPVKFDCKQNLLVSSEANFFFNGRIRSFLKHRKMEKHKGKCWQCSGSAPLTPHHLRETCSHLMTELRSAAALKWLWIFDCRWLSATSWNRGSCAIDILWESGKRVGEVCQGWGGSQNRVERSRKSVISVWFQQGEFMLSICLSLFQRSWLLYSEMETPKTSTSLVLSEAGRSSGSTAVLQDEPQACAIGSKFTPKLEEWHAETEK